MLLHADASQCIKTPYQMITINYFPTSVKRLYQIGSTTGEWLEYKDIPIKVNQGQTIYAKGIDKYGNETKITSATVNVEDALESKAYDRDESTYERSYGSIKIRVDSGLWGKKLYVNCYTWTGWIEFHNANGGIIGDKIKYNSSSSTIKGEYEIPKNTEYVMFSGGSNGIMVYEIYIVN